MTTAVVLALLCAAVTLTLVGWIARRDPDHHRSWRPLTRDERVWTVESPRKVPHE